jgi:hypothetical protein
MYSFLPNIIGIGLRIMNDEGRFSSTAHNLRASLRYRHSLGDEFTVSRGIWYDGDKTLADHVSLGMQEQRFLMLSVLDNQNESSHQIINNIPPDTINAPHLDYGEWAVDVTITGDNAKLEFNGTLTIQKKGGLGWALRQQ